MVGVPQMVEMESTGGYGKYVEKSLGTLRVESAGEQTVRIKPNPEAWQPINLRRIELRLVPENN